MKKWTLDDERREQIKAEVENGEHAAHRTFVGSGRRAFGSVDSSAFGFAGVNDDGPNRHRGFQLARKADAEGEGQ